MTTLGKNVFPLAVSGKFDDCQALVKQAFVDPDLAGLEPLLGQLHQYRKAAASGGILLLRILAFVAGRKGCVFSVPSGNFGDLMGGLIALKMGLPVHRFIAATNENDEFPNFVRTGVYEPIKPSKNCISNAMNVGHPSNLARLFDLYGGRMDETGHVSRQPDMEQLRRQALRSLRHRLRDQTDHQRGLPEIRHTARTARCSGLRRAHERLSRVRRLESLHLTGDCRPGQVPG